MLDFFTSFIYVEGVSIVEFMQFIPLKMLGDGGEMLFGLLDETFGDFVDPLLSWVSLMKSSKVLITRSSGSTFAYWHKILPSAVNLGIFDLDY